MQAAVTTHSFLAKMLKTIHEEVLEEEDVVPVVNKLTSQCQEYCAIIYKCDHTVESRSKKTTHTHP